jgi:hypothetical protein
MLHEQRFMRVAIAILLASIAAVAWRLWIERQHVYEQREQIRELTSRLKDKQTRDRLDLQEKCALQAEKVFRAMGYKLEADSLQSHYHPAKGRCFMLMSTFPKSNPDGSVITFKYLLDAYEQKSFAEYGWRARNDKPYSEVRPFMCKLIRSVGNEVACTSTEEFEQFVATYME